MINGFYMNGDWWSVRWTDPTDPILVDRTNVLTCAVTDPQTIHVKFIYHVITANL